MKLLVRHQARRNLAHLSIFSIVCFHKRSPWIIAWWAAAFPGFGHYLLGIEEQIIE